MLTSYKGNTITYDAIGNPLNWGTDISDMHWNNGRRLTYLQKRTNMISYAYDETGLRTEKSTNTNRTYFDRDASGNLVHEFRDYSGYLGEDSHLYYYYDAKGSIGSISYTGVRYAFRKNLQGDVIAILDTSGNVVARYTYDAWGRILSITDGNGNANTSSTFIGNVNPIRYRGYYYDTETGWYYLNSRYYDPQVKRFINADGIIGANGIFTGYNLFAYCNNNPVVMSDPSGCISSIDIYGSHRVPGGNPDGSAKYEAGFREGDYYVVDGVTHQRPIDLNKPNNGVNDSLLLPPENEMPFHAPTTTSNTVDTHTSDVLGYAGSWLGMQKTVIASTPAGLTPASSAGLTAYAYAVSSPLNIASYWTNPKLTYENKVHLTGLEVTYAFAGIALSYALANCWNPTGWGAAIASGVGLAYSGITMYTTSSKIEKMQRINSFFY